MSKAQTGPFDSVEEAVVEVAAGHLVIVTDDEARENEGDLVMAAARATPEAINTMIRHGRGLICVPMIDSHLRRLGIHLMVQENRESHRTAFTVSVDAAEGITTGISAYDRAETIRLLADPRARPDQLVQPGHIFPLVARSGGVLQRAGHTEAAVDLAQLAGLPPAGVLCEILNEDGSMARLPDLVKFREEFGLKMISIAQLIEYRHRRDTLIERVSRQPFACEYGAFTLTVYRSVLDQRQHLVLSCGEIGPEPVLVRVHSENPLQDLFREAAKNPADTVARSLRRIAEEGQGVFLYMEQPSQGLALDPAPANGEAQRVRPLRMDFRDYGVGAQILADLGVKRLRLLSNTPRRVVALDGYGLEITEQVPLA